LITQPIDYDGLLLKDNASGKTNHAGMQFWRYSTLLRSGYHLIPKNG